MTSRGASQTEPFDPAVVAFCERLVDQLTSNSALESRLLGLLSNYAVYKKPLDYHRLIQLFLSAAPSDRSDA